MASLIPATRPRSELDYSSTSPASDPALSGTVCPSCLGNILTNPELLLNPEPEPSRARKRQRIGSPSSSISTSPIDPSISRTYTTMRYPGSEQAEDSSSSPDAVAGPSSVGLDHPGPSNGHLNGNGFAATANGASGVNPTGNGVQKHNGHSKQSSTTSHSLSVARVTLPGSSLYDDSDVDREEFIRLVIQSLRDVGYMCVT